MVKLEDRARENTRFDHLVSDPKWDRLVLAVAKKSNGVPCPLCGKFMDHGVEGRGHFLCHPHRGNRTACEIYFYPQEKKAVCICNICVFSDWR